jgi:3',5'-cyclic AMP phosphodiesterase CpdA
MTTLLQVSDTHFGTEQDPVLQALVDLARAEAPDLVVLSGDITQRARSHQFRAARSFMDRLDPPALLAIPGNHDIPLFNLAARLLAPYRNYAREFGNDLEPEFESPELLVIGVNTTRPQRHKDGELSPQQIERVAARARRAAPAQLRVAVVHQPVLAIEPGDEENLLHNRAPAIAEWAAAGIDIVMGGHVHLPYVRSLLDSYPDLPRDVWTVQAGTAVSSRIREGVPNSVNIVRCQGETAPRRCVVERWDFTQAPGRFVRRGSDDLAFTHD